MAVTRWAAALRCDYPGCESTAISETESGVPDGWLCLGVNMLTVRDAFGRALSEFCHLHAGITLSELSAAVAITARPTP